MCTHTHFNIWYDVYTATIDNNNITHNTPNVPWRECDPHCASCVGSSEPLASVVGSESSEISPGMAPAVAGYTTQ